MDATNIIWHRRYVVDNIHEYNVTYRSDFLSPIKNPSRVNYLDMKRY